jgi:DNA (cytosine-5)-methyltransferase 1
MLKDSPIKQKSRLSISDVSKLLNVSKDTLRRWDESALLTSQRDGANNYRFYTQEQLSLFEEVRSKQDSSWDEEFKSTPICPYRLLELFAGAGGLALGMEKAVIHYVKIALIGMSWKAIFPILISRHITIKLTF